MPIINRDIIQGSDEWFAAKVGKPSASNASKLITSVGAPSRSMKAYAQTLGGELYAGRSIDPFQGTISTDYGNEAEEESRLAYGFLKGVDVEQVAFIEDDLQQYIVSPDGLVGDTGLVELKNKPKHHLTTLLYYKKHGKIPTDYIAQLQMQLLISEREYVDIFYHSPFLPWLCVRVTPDEKIIAGLKTQLAACLVERNLVLKELKSF